MSGRFGFMVVLCGLRCFAELCGCLQLFFGRACCANLQSFLLFALIWGRLRGNPVDDQN